MTELLFYRQITALDKDKHRLMRIGAMPDFKFAAKTNSVPIVCAEFVEAAREYPIVFAKTQSGLSVPLALLGMRDEENLFVTQDGRWDARYIPAFVRRYPFVFANNGGDQFLVCVDDSHPCVGDKDGERLFADNGETLPFLTKVLGFLQDFHGESLRSEEFVKRLGELNLFTEVAANAALKDGAKFQLNGFSIIDEKRFQALDQAVVEEFFRKGWLGLIYAHLMSLGNLGRLADRLANQDAAGQ